MNKIVLARRKKWMQILRKFKVEMDDLKEMLLRLSLNCCFNVSDSLNVNSGPAASAYHGKCEKQKFLALPWMD